MFDLEIIRWICTKNCHISEISTMPDIFEHTHDRHRF